MVLRRAPRPPLPPSAHDMLREARVLGALHGRARVPRVLAVCSETDVLGVPFYVMEEVRGHVVTEELPASLGSAEARRRAGDDLVDALVELHAVDIEGAGLTDFGRPDGYLERQVRRFAALWEHNATRELPLVAELGAWLGAALPVVRRGLRRARRLPARQRDARPGGARACSRCSTGSSRRWATRSPTSATSSPPGATRTRAPTVLDLSPVTRSDGFPSRAELVGALRRAQRARRRRARVVRGARALEGGGVLRGPLRPLPARRDGRPLDGEPRARACRACCVPLRRAPSAADRAAGRPRSGALLCSRHASAASGRPADGTPT